MNLNICKEKCSIKSIRFITNNNIDLIDNNGYIRNDLPCQNWMITINKYGVPYGSLNPKIELINKDIFIRYNSLLNENNTIIKYFRCGRQCPYYAEHMIFDEN